MIADFRKAARVLRLAASAEHFRIAGDEDFLRRTLEQIDPVECIFVANHLEDLAAVLAERMTEPKGDVELAARTLPRIPEADASVTDEPGVRLIDGEPRYSAAWLDSSGRLTDAGYERPRFYDRPGSAFCE